MTQMRINWASRSRNAPILAFLLAGCLTGIAAFSPAPTGTNSPATTAIQANEDKQACMENLKQIYQAIQAFEADRKDLPNWLSDLVPQYLPDANMLVCPVCRRTGKIESPPLSDPRIPSSYLFEFCPLPLGNEAPKAPNRTRRDWKRRQMGLVGSIVPIVRCRHHDPVLNLAFDGKIYESPAFWELAFTNRINAAQLTAGKLFEEESSVGSSVNAKPGANGRGYPTRDPGARNQLIDLTSFYNAALTESWHGNAGNDLASLPSGLQTLAGIEFDVRGIIQLAGKAAILTNWPHEVKGIKVRQQCKHLYFLHSTGHGNVGDEGKQIGSYVVHYSTNQMRLEIPIYYGRSVRDWHVLANEPEAPKELTVAWKGENALSRRSGNSIRLFMTTWTNLVPGFEIDSVDFVSNLEGPAPFLIAVTAD